MVKIQDKEILEPPHVTLRRRSRRWRIDLRRRDFMDDHPPVREVPHELLANLQARWRELEDAWNQMYPSNPVRPPGDER